MKLRSLMTGLMPFTFLGTLLSALSGCASTSHKTIPAKIGKPVSAAYMESLLDQPGPVELKTVATVDWVVDLKGLLNLDDPKVQAAGIKNRDEPIQVYAHFLRHPTRGLFMVDTGVSRHLIDDPTVGVSWLVKMGMHLEKMKFRQSTLEALQLERRPVNGVLLTHLHLDHISGLPDIPLETPIFTGPNEAGDAHALNAVTQGTTNHLLDGRPPIQELQFTPDPSGRFEGVLDLFEDGSVFAIQSGGHTAGSVAYVVRTPSGAVLLTGDTCHTRWGWDHGVEPGSFTVDRERNRKNLIALKELSARHPRMVVKLGHQP